MDVIEDSIIEPLYDFAVASRKLIMQCDKPGYKEFSQVAFATIIGFLIMGCVGFFIKLIHIPINNIIVGG